MGIEKDFFNDLKDHSKIKLKVLDMFFIPWVSKVFYNPKNISDDVIMVFDGFAGAGKYKDKKGSPLILLEKSFEASNFRLNVTDKNNKNMKIKLFFCEKDENNFNALVTNIETDERLECKNKKLNKKTLKNNIEFLSKDEKIFVGVSNDDYNLFIKKFIEKRKKNAEYRKPCFVFIDPFGYKDIDFEDIKELLNTKKVDIIFNMMYDNLNRFIKKDDLKELFQKYLGASKEEIEKLNRELDGEFSEERAYIITNFYKEKYRELGYFVNDIKIKKKNTLKMVLFYVTKSISGFNLFKEVRNEIESSLEELKLFGTFEEIQKKEIEKFLFENYFDKEVVTYEKILKVIKEHEIYTETMFNATIRQLRKEKKILTYVKENDQLKISNKHLKGTCIEFKKE